MKNKLLKVMVGMVLLVSGAALILSWWDQVVYLFKGGIGMLLAAAGLLTLYLAEQKS